jgi:hypothetical protein
MGLNLFESSKVGEIGGVRYAGAPVDIEGKAEDVAEGFAPWDIEELLRDNTGVKRGESIPVTSNCHVSHALRHVLHPFFSDGSTWRE